MAELTTLARPYAKAAFEYAHAEHSLQAWSDMLALMAAVAQHDTMHHLLTSPGFTAQEKGRAFIEVCSEKLTDKGQNFVKTLACNKRMELLPEIQQLFELYKANQEKTIDVDVATAFELLPQLQDRLAQALSDKLDRQVIVHSRVDTALLGGAVVRTGDTVIDGSVRGRLAKLAEAMNA